MNKGQDVVISRTANGFIVTPVDGYVAKGVRHADAMVFGTIEQLTGWISVHFSRAEPVGVPRVAPQGSPDAWTPRGVASGSIAADSLAIARNDLQLRDRPVEAADWPEAPRRERLDP